MEVDESNGQKLELMKLMKLMKAETVQSDVSFGRNQGVMEIRYFLGRLVVTGSEAIASSPLRKSLAFVYWMKVT
jgi:hypothetical protein